MNYLKLAQIKKTYFSYEEVSRALDISLSSAKVACNRFIKNGLLVRVKRNIYILKDHWVRMDKKDKFTLANLLQSPSYISLMTALDYYGITTQIQRDFVESLAVHRTKEIEVQGSLFRYTKINKKLYFGFIKEGGVFIATPEKAFLDASYLVSLKRYKFDLSSIDFNKINMRELKKIKGMYPAKTQKLVNQYGYFKKA